MGWEKNADEYITKYCDKHQVTFREALRHAIVTGAIDYYKQADEGKIYPAQMEKTHDS